MLTISVRCGIAFVAVAILLAAYRVVRGPSAPDRVLALDTIYVDSIALVVLLGIARSSALYFEAAIVIALMGFVGTVALCKFLLRGDIVE